ncbi:MAG: hypothetical protein Q8P41_07410 [Pseudomonadota bacterium]|nr:hypothetical protein [Pseudomonadota bacterium]
MKKSVLPVVAALALFSFSASAAVTVRYYNRDSTKYEFEAVCSGSKSKAVFSASTTSSYSIQGSGPCKVHTEQGDVTLAGGESIEIKGGKITIK